MSCINPYENRRRKCTYGMACFANRHAVERLVHCWLGMINPAEIRAIVERMRSEGRITSAEPDKATDKQSLLVRTVNRQLTVAKCDQCGTEFVQRNNRNRRCSQACTKHGALMMRRRRGGHQPLGDERTCEQCGTRFRQGSIWQRHCRPLCTRRARSRREHQKK